MPTPQTQTPPAHQYLSEFRRSIAQDLVFTLLTCGFYSFFWKYKQFQAVNALVGKNKYSFWMWLLLSLLTCSLYYFYNTWAVAQDVVKLKRHHKLHPNTLLPFASLLLTLFGFVIVADALVQNEINEIIDKLSQRQPSI